MTPFHPSEPASRVAHNGRNPPPKRPLGTSLRGKPDYHLDGGSADFVISAVPPNRREKNPVGADNHDRKIALLILHIPG